MLQCLSFFIYSNAVDLTTYSKEERTISAIKANLYMIALFIPALLILGLPYIWLWHESFTIESLRAFYQQYNASRLTIVLIVMVVILVGVVLHELIHGITWALFAKGGFRSIHFGIQWSTFTPYCHCRDPLMLRHYLIGGIMPAVVLGFLPYGVSLVNGDALWFITGLFFIIAAGGDFMILNLLRKENMNSHVQDHPDKIGCYVFRQP